MSIVKDDNNFCGGNGKMLSFAPDGKAYPCIRYAPISVGDELACAVCVGDCNNGLYNRPEEKAVLDELSKITRTSQSTEQCNNCSIGTGCGWCSAFNYEYHKCFNKRVTNICNAHQARSAAILYYLNKRYLELGDVAPRENTLPKEKVLNFISKEEYQMLDDLSKEATSDHKKKFG